MLLFVPSYIFVGIVLAALFGVETTTQAIVVVFLWPLVLLVMLAGLLVMRVFE